ncbi:MAG: hypothetical protein IIB39_00825 [Candidatus Marinimicrobia bacterium]|nr:hypothetical protein [Candidatus Neomarinimicrobiota bacterium]
MKSYLELCESVMLNPAWPLEGPLKSLTLEVEKGIRTGDLCVEYCQEKIDSLQKWLNDIKLAHHREHIELEEAKK